VGGGGARHRSQRLRFAEALGNSSGFRVVGATMKYDESKIDEAVLAVLYLTAFERNGATFAWKGIDWEATDGLFERGLIHDPKGVAKPSCSRATVLPERRPPPIDSLLPKLELLSNIVGATVKSRVGSSASARGIMRSPCRMSDRASAQLSRAYRSA
jgi:hypothetical protein